MNSLKKNILCRKKLSDFKKAQRMALTFLSLNWRVWHDDLCGIFPESTGNVIF